MNVGVLFVLLALASAGVLVDFLVENSFSSAPSESFQLFGISLHLSGPEQVLAGFVLGALAVLLLFLGVGLFRGSWGRRRAIKKRVSDLESENTKLRSQGHLASTARPAGYEAQKDDA